MCCPHSAHLILWDTLGWSGGSSAPAGSGSWSRVAVRGAGSQGSCGELRGAQESRAGAGAGTRSEQAGEGWGRGGGSTRAGSGRDGAGTCGVPCPWLLQAPATGRFLLQGWEHVEQGWEMLVPLRAPAAPTSPCHTFPPPHATAEQRLALLRCTSWPSLSTSANRRGGGCQSSWGAALGRGTGWGPLVKWGLGWPRALGCWNSAGLGWAIVW